MTETMPAEPPVVPDREIRALELPDVIKAQKVHPRVHVPQPELTKEEYRTRLLKLAFLTLALLVVGMWSVLMLTLTAYSHIVVSTAWAMVGLIALGVLYQESYKGANEAIRVRNARDKQVCDHQAKLYSLIEEASGQKGYPRALIASQQLLDARLGANGQYVVTAQAWVHSFSFPPEYERAIEAIAREWHAKHYSHQ